MGLESFGKLLGGLASTTAVKAGEQVQITRLAIDKAGIEKQIEGVYCAMGRYCHTRIRRGEEIAREELLEYCRDVETLEGQVESLSEEISQHKQRRDAAAYRMPPDEEPSGDPFYAEAADIPAQDGAVPPEQSKADAPAEPEIARQPEPGDNPPEAAQDSMES